MACGNNHITRDYLVSAPTSVGASTAAAFLNPVRSSGKPSTQELGESGEALVARLLVEGMQHELVHQHTPGARPQGVDLVTLAPDGRLMVTEVKSTAAAGYRAPHTTQNVTDHQLDADWTSKNLSATGLVDARPESVGDASDQVSRQIAQFDAVSGTVSFWEVDSGGQRSEMSPSEIHDVQPFEEEARE